MKKLTCAGSAALGHAGTFERYAQWLGVDDLKALVPFSRERIVAALASGDEHLNTLPLRQWDKLHGYGGPSKAIGHCPQCSQVLPAPAHGGVWALIGAALRRDGGGSMAWSVSDTVCVLKHVAKYHVAGMPLPPSPAVTS